ncbi:MAG: S8 family serine peptidase [Bacteroidales bacterium]|nr:S8 family serine peptidase [Bacteroidales bacterium]
MVGKRLIYTGVLLGILTLAKGQVQLIREGSAEERRSEIGFIEPAPERKQTLRSADSLQLLSKQIYPDGRIVAIRGFNARMKPEFLTTHNLMAARTLSTDRVWTEGGLAYHLDGSGVVVGVWDGGVHRSTHVEFDSRALILDGSDEVAGHSTHVSGTIGASGLNASARGMAGKVIIEAYDWDQDLQEMEAAASQGLLISNHSYGLIAGWDYNSDQERWQWWGDLSISGEEDYLFGFYHRDAREYDRIARRHPDYLIVKSAGNDRGEGPSPGTEHYVWENGAWVVSPVVRDKDGGDEGFDTMGPSSTAKNILTVGAVRDMPLGYTGRENVMITSFSAFGPTDDGRIKPDLVANGDRLFSAYSESDEDYRNSSGTSMSAPNVSGSLALIQQHHADLYGSYLNAASLKGLVLHTADDAGVPGPDYKYGWGLMNTLNAVNLISDERYDRLQEATLPEGGEYRLSLYSNGEEPIKVSICWTDPEGIVPAAELDPVKRMLVNDLDLRVVRLVDGKEIQAFILDPLHPDRAAIRGDNVLDNVEQVLEELPLKGFYEVIVSHKESLSGESQDFSIVFSGLRNEYYASGLNELTANNGEFKLSSAPEYLPDMDVAWIIEPENSLPVTLYFDFFNTEEANDLLTIYDGADENAPLLATLDGSPDTETLEFNSSSGQLFVRFRSDSQNEYPGFRALYCTSAPEETAHIQGELYPCNGTSSLYLASGVSGVDYLWAPPEGWFIDSLIADGAYLNVGPVPGLLHVEVFNRCGSGPVSMVELTPLDTVPFLTNFQADTMPCAAVPTWIEVDSLPGTTYKWSLPVDWLGTSISHTLEYIPGYEPGLIRVQLRNACGFGDTLNLSIDVKRVPAETQILSSRDSPCALSEQEFYVNPLEAHSYQWTTIDDWSIEGGSEGDTVLVRVGMEASFIFVNATNKCGSRQSNKLYLTSPLPDPPVVRVSDSEYEGYKLLAVSNSSDYSSFQWYRDGWPLESQMAREPEFVAHLPGLYTLGVSNREACEYIQDEEDGIEIDQENQDYSVYTGLNSHLVVLNHTSDQALLHIYDFLGKLRSIETLEPGHNEIPFPFSGSFIVRVSGSGNTLTNRVFTY